MCMRIFCNKKIWRNVWKATCFLIFLLLIPFAHSVPENQNPSQIKSSKNSKDNRIIKTQSDNTDLNKTDKKKSNSKLIEIFNSTLFSTSPTDTNSSYMWLHDPETQEKRSEVIGAQSNIFEGSWKFGLEGFLLNSRTDFTEVIRTRVNSKIITRFTESFSAEAEFELLTGTGSIQKIYQRIGETEGVTQREVLLSYKATNWLTIRGGVINQRFLDAPLLLTKIPFPSIVENVELFKGEEHHLSLIFQQAIPTTFSDSHSIYTQELTKTPLLITKSFFWNYNPKSFYKINFKGTFFHYNPLPSDIAAQSWFYGNSIEGEPATTFKYRYTGFHIGLEPSFQIFPNLGLKIKIHYINNISKMKEGDHFNQGELYSIQLPFDVTENIRIIPIFEYFTNQSNASVGYYNSERYGHSNRTGYVGELIISFYNRNLEVGFRHLNSREVVEKGINPKQFYYFLFLRTNYVNI